MAESKVLRVDFDRDIGEKPDHGYTLPARYYLDPEVYAQEKAAIFYRTWHYIAHVSQLAEVGDYATLRIADEHLLVVRDRDGQLRGFFNVCKHRAHLLLSGAGNTKSIVCPYHAWAYGLDGQLKAARKAERVAGFDRSEICLDPIRVEVFCGFVFVNLDPAATSLAEQAGDLAEDIERRIPRLAEFRPVETFALGDAAGMKAGWKVVVDNYVECYHCTPAHPAFADMIEMSAYRMDTFDLWSRQLGPETRPHNKAYDFAADTAFSQAAFWYLWPTTTINLFPGAGHLGIFSILPLDLETTVFVGHRYALPDAADEAEGSRAFGYLNAILGPEDQALCESVQQGLKSRAYNQGRFIVDPEKSGTAEHAVHHFHRLVLDALESA